MGIFDELHPRMQQMSAAQHREIASRCAADIGPDLPVEIRRYLNTGREEFRADAWSAALVALSDADGYSEAETAWSSIWSVACDTDDDQDVAEWAVESAVRGSSDQNAARARYLGWCDEYISPGYANGGNKP